jgi:hypothetical protein
MVPLDSSEDHTELTLVSNDPKTDLPGCFTSLDGHYLKGFLSKISIKPGERKVGYMCQAILDGPEITLTANFKPRKAYLVRCAGAGATVEEQ